MPHNPWEIQAMLDLMLKLQLEHHSVTSEDLHCFNSFMLEIKASSHPNIVKTIIHINLIGKVNTTFNKFVTDYLSMQLAFDNWYPFLVQGKTLN